MRPYHPNNIKMTGHVYWRLAALAWAGKLLGIQFHVDGLPFGSAYRRDLYPTDSHDSDCATHNEPANPNGPCDCRAA